MMKKHGYVVSLLSGIMGVFVFAAGACSHGETRPSIPLSEQEITCLYTVQKGETLSRIASRLTGRTAYYPEIMRGNNLTSETIYAGDILQIPRRLLLPQYQCVLDTQQPTSDPAETPPTPSQNTDTKVLAEIEALVFEDRNDNGEYDTEEPGVPGIRIILVRAGGGETSDEQGLVVFEEVEPGDHAVGIDESTLPEGYRLCTKSTVLLSVAEGDKAYAAFGVRMLLSK